MKGRSFRLSEKALANLKQYAKQIDKNLNFSLNQILENKEPKRSEHTEGIFRELPPFLKCPYDLEAWEETTKVLTRCPACNWKKHCPAWKGRITELPLVP